MTKEEALKIFIEVAKLAQKGGLLALEDSVRILKAIEVLTEKKDDELLS
jgi:flagellar motor component MotA